MWVRRLIHIKPLRDGRDRVDDRVRPLADQQMAAIGDRPKTDIRTPGQRKPVLDRYHRVSRAPEHDRSTAKSAIARERRICENRAPRRADVGVLAQLGEEP